MAATFLAGMKALERTKEEGNAGDSKESEFSLDVVVGEEGGDSGEDDVDGEEYEREQHSTTNNNNNNEKKKKRKRISRL